MPLPSDKINESPRIEQAPVSIESATRAESFELASGSMVESVPTEMPATNLPALDVQATADADVVELKQIEKLMSRGLEDPYLAMSADKRAVFRRRGEETALKIMDMLEKGRVSVKEIVSLLIQWLQMLPGLNKFFIEQEAKIRADEIMRLDEERHQNQ